MKTQLLNSKLMQLSFVVSSFLAIVYCVDPDNKHSAAADAVTAIFIFTSILICGLTVAYSLREWNSLQVEIQKTKRCYYELIGKSRKTRYNKNRIR